MATAAAISAGGAIAQDAAQSKASKANKANALAAMADTWRALGIRQQQEQQSAAQTIMQTDRQARTAKALASVSAGEAGVAGASVDALLTDINVQRLTADTTTERNLQMVQDQIQAEKTGAKVQAQNRINAVPSPSGLQTGLQVLGAGLQFGTEYIRRKDSLYRQGQ